MDNAETPDEERKELYAYGAGLQSLSEIVGLDRFVKLEFLSLHGNFIERIEGVERLPLLKELNLSSNRIKQMDGLGHLSQLQVLNLSCNYIEEIKDLQGLSALRKLVLSHNRISCLGGLSALHGPRYALRTLDLRDNVVSSVAELEVLAGCVNLTELTFSSGNHTNPVCRAPAYKSAVVASVPHIIKLDGKTLCAESGPTGTSQCPSLIGGIVQSSNAGSLPSWALERRDNNLQDPAFNAEQFKPWQVFSQRQPEIPFSSQHQRHPNSQRESHFSDSPNNHPYLKQGQFRHNTSPNSARPRSVHSPWVKQPTSSHLVSVGSLSHPHSNKVLTSLDTQALGPCERSGQAYASTRGCGGLPLRKLAPSRFDYEGNAGTEFVQGDFDVPKADHASQTNPEAWLGALEKKILDLITQLPSLQANSHGETIGHHKDAAVAWGGSKIQRLDRIDAFQDQRSKQTGDAHNMSETLCSSEDTSDGRPRLKSPDRTMLSTGESESESPELESAARRWVHFGDKWKGKKVTRPGRKLDKEIVVTPAKDSLEQLYEEVKNLQAGLASLTSMYRGKEALEEKLEEQSKRTTEIKEDEKDIALSKLKNDCAMLESKLVSSEEKFSEERKDLLKRMELDQEERRKLHELLNAEQEERKKLYENLNSEQGQREKLQDSLKAVQEETSDLHKTLEAKRSTICQLEKMLQDKDFNGREMSKQVQKFAAERSQMEALLQEKYRDKYLSLNTKIISMKEALNVATQARQNAESELLDATVEKESARQLAMSVSQEMEEEKAKLGVCNSELETCRSRLLELQEQVDKSSKDLLDARVKNEKALEQLSKLHKQKLQEAISHEFAAGKSQGMLEAEKKLDMLRHTMDTKLKVAQDDLQTAHEETAKIRQDMCNLQSEKEREEATLKEAIRKILQKDQEKDALVIELSSVVRCQKLKLQNTQLDLERLAEVEEDLGKMHQEMIVVRRKADKCDELTFEAEGLRKKLVELNKDAERQKQITEEKFRGQLVCLQKENERLLTSLQKLEASEDAVRVKNKMLDSQNDTIRELKLELSQAKEAFRRALKTSEALEAEWSTRLQHEANQGEDLQSQLAKQELTITAMEEKLRFERAAKMAAEKASKGLQEKLAEKEDMFRYVEEEISQVKEMYDSKLKEAGVQRDQALDELKVLHQEKQQLLDALTDARRRREELLEAAKTQEKIKKEEATGKSLQLAQALQRVVEVEGELKSQGLAMESQKLVLVSKLDQLHKLLEELRAGN